MKSVHKQMGRWVRQLLSGTRGRDTSAPRTPLRSLDSHELKQVAGGTTTTDTPTKGW
jgi:hypothetical protein